MGSTSSAALLAASVASLAAVAAGLDAVPPRSEPFRWLNQQGHPVECSVTPWQLIELGKIGTVRIYAGDHCSVPMSDPLTADYKKLFRRSCDVHDVCYLTPGNSKAFCDDALKARMDADCDRAYAPDSFANKRCHMTASSWRAGLETPISTRYWDRSQEWGRRNCSVGAPSAGS